MAGGLCDLEVTSWRIHRPFRKRRFKSIPCSLHSQLPGYEASAAPLVQASTSETGMHGWHVIDVWDRQNVLLALVFSIKKHTLPDLP